MRIEASHHWIVVPTLAVCLLTGAAAAQNANPAAVPQTAGDADPAAALRDGLRHLAVGNPQQAAAHLQRLIEADPAGLDLQTACTAAGQAFSQCDDHAAAARYYRRALEAAENQPAENTGNQDTGEQGARKPDARTVVLRIAAAGACLRCGQLDSAIQYSRQVMELDADGALAPIAAEHRTMACRIRIAALIAAERLPEAVEALVQVRPATDGAAARLGESAQQLAATCLADDRPVEAMAVYQWYLDNLPSGGDRDRAALGIAWSAALGAEPPEQAGARLQRFVDAHPDHADAPRALRAAMACWTKAGQADRADQLRREAIRRWPGTAAAITAVNELSGAGRDDRGEAVSRARRSLLLEPTEQMPDRAADADFDTALSTASIAAALRDAAASEDQTYWHAAIEAAVVHPSSGTCIEDALQRLAAADRAADAERLAVAVLGELADPERGAAAIEAVCRWAAGSARWTMLGLAAEGVDPTAVASGLGAASVRWIAESFVQTSRGKLAQAWLDVAVERLKANDFETLIRRAELSVAFDPLDVAQRRVEAAAATADLPHDQCLVEMLRAEISIRRARLDEARATLERLVRGDRATAELRGRAQWLIGETFLLEERYTDAVEAYRRVESMDPSGTWTAAALVQAGKAFERLGRQRDAAVCYSALIQRFATSHHATTAHDRLAAIRDQPLRR